MKPRSHYSTAHSRVAVPLWVLAFTLHLSVAAVWAVVPMREGEPYGIYAWAEAAAVVVVGTATAVDDQALHVEVDRALRGQVPPGRLAVTPSLVEGCTGAFPVLRQGERAVLFIKGGDAGTSSLVAPGAVLSLRQDEPAALAAVVRILRVTTLPTDERRARAVVHLLESGNVLLRRAARECILLHPLFRADPDRFAPVLVPKLSSPDPEVRAIAARGLEPATIPALVETFIRATRDPNLQVVTAASQALAKFNTDQSVKALLALFKHPESAVRVRAYLDVSKHVRSDVVKALVEATHDPDPGARGIAATALIYSIRQGKAQAALPRLKEMLSDRDAEASGPAVRALGETRDPTLVGTFLDLLGDKPLSDDLEWQVVTALGMLPRDGTVRTALRGRVPRLAASLRVGHRAAPAAVSLLVAAGTPQARRALEDVAEHHPRPDVRQHAALGLQYWDAGT